MHFIYSILRKGHEKALEWLNTSLNLLYHRSHCKVKLGGGEGGGPRSGPRRQCSSAPHHDHHTMEKLNKHTGHRTSHFSASEPHPSMCGATPNVAGDESLSEAEPTGEPGPEGTPPPPTGTTDSNSYSPPKSQLKTLLRRPPALSRTWVRLSLAVC